jgi:hypothetical protein
MKRTNKVKKPLTATQKMRKYRAIQYVALGGEFVSVVLPYIILGAVNFNEWFVCEQGWKVGLGGSIALTLMGLAVWLTTKKKENKELTSGWITFIIAWFAVAFVFQLLGSIIDQIASIMFVGGVGIVGAFGLDEVSIVYKKKANAYKMALQDVKQSSIEDEAKAEVRQEQETKSKEPIE